MLNIRIFRLGFATALLGMASAGLPAFALTPPAMTLTDGTAANTVTIDSTGTVTFGAGCACTTTVAATASGGVITWSGTVGAFTVVGATGETKPFLPMATAPTIDIGIGTLTTTTTGTLTVSWTDTSFTGMGPTSAVALTTYSNPSGTTSASDLTNYSTYVDTTNAAFGEGTLTTSSLGTGSGIIAPSGAGPSASPFSMTVVEAITLAAGDSFTNDFSEAETATASSGGGGSGSGSTPGVTITKKASATKVNPFQKVTYTYVVTNSGNTTLTNLTVTDDNATPNYAGDDFTVCTIATLAAGASQTCTASVYPPVTESATDTGGWDGWGGYGGWGGGSGTPHSGGTLICQSKANGNIVFTYLVDQGTSDNTYGKGSSSGWGWIGGSFKNLTDDAAAEFQVLDGQGNKVLDFVADYCSPSSAYPSGYGTCGVKGGGGYIYSGNAANICSIDTTITDNLNNRKVFNKCTQSSPTGSPDWKNQCGYKVEVSCNAWGSKGFGGVNCPKVQHIAKNNGCNQHVVTPTSSTATNTATVIAYSGTTELTATAKATVTIDASPQGWSKCQLYQSGGGSNGGGSYGGGW